MCMFWGRFVKKEPVITSVQCLLGAEKLKPSFSKDKA